MVERQPLAWYQKIGLICLGVLLFIVLLECGLRVAGFCIDVQKICQNRRINNACDYCILCLGESTTANEYPLHLEEALAKYIPKTSIRVIDGGIRATDSAKIVAVLKDNLNRYQPNIVVAMMGVNDVEDTPCYEDSLEMSWRLMVRNIRVYKLFNLLCQHIIYKLLIVPAPERDVTLMEVDYIGDGEYSQAEDILRKALKENPHSDVLYANLGALYFKQLRLEEAIKYYRKAIELQSENDIAFGGLALCYLERGDRENARNCFDQARIIRSHRPKKSTIHNYAVLKQKVMERGATLVCVQYPLRDVDLLKDMIAFHKGVVFVDNEEIFKNAVSQSSYHEYFRDNFVGDFGHCTVLGNKLLAANVAKAIYTNIIKQSSNRINSFNVSPL